jgi:hypothetical protein
MKNKLRPPPDGSLVEKKRSFKKQLKKLVHDLLSYLSVRDVLSYSIHVVACF